MGKDEPVEESVSPELRRLLKLAEENAYEVSVLKGHMLRVGLEISAVEKRLRELEATVKEMHDS